MTGIPRGGIAELFIKSCIEARQKSIERKVKVEERELASRIKQQQCYQQSLNQADYNRNKDSKEIKRQCKDKPKNSKSR